MPVQRSYCQRVGSILPLLVICLLALMAMIALAVDIGLVAVARTQAQDVADLAALSGARMLNGDSSNTANLNNVTTAVAAAQTAADNNNILGKSITTSMITTLPGVYAYNATSQTFSASYPSSPGANAWSVMQVTVNTTTPTYFGRVFNVNSFNVTANASAAHRPRDLALILDFSGSMKFGSTSACLTGNFADFYGSMNSDPVYPQFGPYYAMSQRPLSTSNTAPTSNGTGYNPMQRTVVYDDGTGYVYSANNITANANGGPPIVQDFLTSVNGGFVNAFYQPQADASYSATQTPVAMPAPNNFQTQSSSPATYVGDVYPRLKRATSGNNWSQTVIDYFTGTNTLQSTTMQTNTGIGSGNTWEGSGSTFGYGANFKGYSMGPAYYGKTFFVWPPDPRWGGGTQAPDPTQISPSNPAKDIYGNYICDWRKRFFCYANSDGTPNRSLPLDDNSMLFNSSGYIQAPGSGSGNYAVNYKAILAWLTSGPQVLPPNLYAGRLVYYTSIPTDIPVTGGTLEQCYWRDYINAVLGIGDDAGGETFYGKEPSGWGTVKITAKSSLYSSGTGTNSPYMHYNDNPIRPRAHFWFGPLTMVMFLTTDNTGRDNMWPGTCHEAHCWQLKAGMNSALTDIQLNHPNDWASLIYFSTEPAYATARVSLSRNYSQMQNALFFPFSLLSVLGDATQQIYPYQYNSSGNYISYTGAGIVPNARGGTCPEMGFQVAYNQFSTASGFSGRRGAAKVVIFETDGVPNAYCGGTFQNNGAYSSYYGGSISSTTSVGNNSTSATTPALQVVTNIAALTTASSPGFSTPRSPARVHAIAFGDLFETTGPEPTAALNFVLNVQQNGNTSSSTDTSIESYKIITGDYNTRIANLQQALQRIMQSGIQVSLIQ
jgi:Putative Flp pilus-assembly TadE/G-like